MPSKKTYRDKPRLLVYPISEQHADDILVYFYRGRITTNWIKEFNAIAGDADSDPDRALVEMARMFCEVTSSWNMTETDEPDSPQIPLTVDEAADLGLALIGGLIRAYIGAINDPEVVESAPLQPSVALLPPMRKGSMAS